MARKLVTKKPKNAAIRRRAPAERTIRNTAKILRASAIEAHRTGLDGITARNILVNAKLTTGAIYSRYENMDELLVALWQESARAPLHQHLQEIVRFMKTSKGTPPDVKLVARMEKPTHDLKLGVEFLVVSRRHNALAEVVLPEVSAWFESWGLSESNSQLGCGAVALSLSAGIGTTLRSFISPKNENWGLVLVSLRDAYAEAEAEAIEPLNIPLEIPSIKARTDNDTRNKLIDATAEVMSRTGFQRSTISRISRKSGITTGSIYLVYPDKESLMNDAIHELLTISSRVNNETKKAADLHHRGDIGLTDSFRIGLIADRQNWLFFRLECVIAARHHRATQKEFAKINELSRTDLAKTFPRFSPGTIELINVAENALGLGFNTLAPYSNQLSRCDFHSIMTTLAKQNGF